MSKDTRHYPSKYARYIIHYGLSQKQVDTLGSCLPENTILHDATDCATDIIALCPTLAVVINPANMLKNDLEMILDYYKDVCWDISELVIFTAKIDIPRTIKIIHIDDSDFTSDKIHELFTQVNSRKKRNDGYHARIALCLSILKMIKNRPGISTKSIAEEYEVSEKSIFRYIATLRVSGEWIDYDFQARGWKLQQGMSSFFC